MLQVLVDTPPPAAYGSYRVLHFTTSLGTGSRVHLPGPATGIEAWSLSRNLVHFLCDLKCLHSNLVALDSPKFTGRLSPCTR